MIIRQWIRQPLQVDAGIIAKSPASIKATARQAADQVGPQSSSWMVRVIQWSVQWRHISAIGGMATCAIGIRLVQLPFFKDGAWIDHAVLGVAINWIGNTERCRGSRLAAIQALVHDNRDSRVKRQVGWSAKTGIAADKELLHRRVRVWHECKSPRRRVLTDRDRIVVARARQ